MKRAGVVVITIVIAAIWWWSRASSSSRKRDPVTTTIAVAAPPRTSAVRPTRAARNDGARDTRAIDSASPQAARATAASHVVELDARDAFLRDIDPAVKRFAEALIDCGELVR